MVALIVAIVAVWLGLSVLVALGFGRAVRIADRKRRRP